jgi:probable rRNA maturation factor
MQNDVEGSEGAAFGELQQIAERMLEILELADAELSLLITDDERMREINLQHRAIDAPTDVLSFPQFEPEPGSVLSVKHLQGELLGDIVLSIDTTTRQATERGVPALEEAGFLLAHGLLHLLGYDHATPEEDAIMTALTRELVDHERTLRAE